ncbi:S-adenosyl-L-methionine-dependent methyltransferase Phc [Chitiniphilus shinanonensis]|uniref:Methyltransferase, UbiE/COQ5 family n=2 Tax=Chitiniphilus shinanonensis TaxID=553088 RepID=F8WST2_9NEIS|nr:methyltransferase, UbiE/COQ5 family [Chitiniphilus shinanonensis]GLS04428.1 S-adenosyl-L-methionine-dependent methyltransferase Phc [Chitiniphilus shinanonensis]
MGFPYRHPEPAMSQQRHDDVVVHQYDPKANAYLTSAVHASGEDLALMAERVASRPDAIVLDMGCGGGHVSFRLAPAVAKVVAYDLSARMLETVAAEAQRRGLDNIVTKQGAAEALPCPDEAFDVIATRYSAHHWRDLPAGLKQMHRALKPGGLGLFMDVVSPGQPLLDTWLQSLELLRDPSHVRDASVETWRHELNKAGFIVDEVVPFRLRLEFRSWIERMQTPAAHTAAIRSLQNMAASEVVEHFGIEADGSFTVDTALLIAHKG